MLDQFLWGHSSRDCDISCFELYFSKKLIYENQQQGTKRNEKLHSCQRLNVNECILCLSVFEEPEDPTNRSFFSEIISSISDVKFSHNGRYMVTRDYLSVKVWDLQMDSKPIETFQVHEYLRSKLCSLYENDCIFDKFECAWSGNDR